MGMFRRGIVALLGAAMVATAAQPVSAQDTTRGRFTGGPVYAGQPNLELTLAMVVAGGGPDSFNAKTLVGVLAGARTKPEVAKLQKQFGSNDVASFLATFDFVVNDAIKLATAANVAMPSEPNPSPADGRALATSLYHAGITPAGSFDVEYLLDRLVGHTTHVQIMNDIDQNPRMGGKVDANYHTVLTQAMKDLAVEYHIR